MRTRHLLALIAIALTVVLGTSSSARAQVNNPYTWTTTDGLWNVPANWLDGLAVNVVPPSDPTTALVFGASGTTSYTSTNDLTSFTLNSMTFNNSGSGVITIAGNSIALGGTTPTFNVSAGSASISAVLTGTSLIKSGAGILILSGANTYTGGTNISAGTLVYAGATVTSTTTAGFPTGTITSGPAGTGAVTIGPGGTFSIDNSNRAMRNVMTFTGTAATPSVVSVPTGQEFTLTGNTTGAGTAVVNKTGDGLWRITGGSSFTGTLNINGGTVLLTDFSNGGTGGDFNATSIVVNNGTKFQFATATPFAGENPDLPAGTIVTINTGGVAEWHVGEDYGGIRLQGGAYNTRVNHNLGLTSILQSGTIGPVLGTAGSLAGAGLIQKTTAGTVTITGVALNNTGGLSVDEGILATSGPIAGSGNIGIGTASTSGTLQYTGALSGPLNRPIVVGNAGGGLDVTNSAVTVTVSGALSGGGPLTKGGAGTLALTGALNQTGLTTVSAGTLMVSPGTSAGGFAAANGATFAVASGAGIASLNLPSLSLGTTGSTVRLDLNAMTVPSVSLLNVTANDGLNLNGGSHILQVASTQQIPVGTFTLIDYLGTGISSGFTLKLPGRTAGTLNYDTANTRIDVTVTGSDSVKWTGAVNSNWDVGSAPNVGGTNNWQLVTGGTATNFIETDFAVFDDTASQFTVNITTAVRPNSLTVNNSTNNYTFQGAGSIDGSTGLLKQGAGTLILQTANTYTGGTTLAGGVLEITADSALGAASVPVTFTGGTLRASATGDLATGGANRVLVLNTGNTGTIDVPTGVTLTVPGLLTGAGTLNKTGLGTVVFPGSNNAFTGTLNVNGGIFRVEDPGAGGDFGAASIIINNGGTFEFVGPAGNADLPAGTVLTVNTGGLARFTEPEDYGAIVLAGGSYDTSDNHNLAATSTLQSGTLNGLSGGAGGSLAGAGLIQKTTTGIVTITGVALNNTGGLNIDEGVLSTDAAIGGSGLISIGTVGPATLQYRGASATVGRAVSLAEAGGTIDVTTAATVYTLSGVVSGNMLTKTGPGTLALSGANTYTGTTTVSAGTLLVNGNQSTATGAVGVAGGTLGGRGTVGGPVTISSTGRINPGTDASNRTLTLSNTLAIDGGKYVVTLFGTGNDTSGTVAATGAVNLTNNPTLELNLNGQTVSGLQAAGPATYTIVTGSSVTGNFVQPDFTSLGFNVNEWTVSTVGNAVILTFSPVPEPATVLGLAAGALGLVGVARRVRLRAKCS